MERRLYREWFVHYRFPGHERVRMVDSAMGKVPEGWELEVFGDLARIERRSIQPRRYSEEVFLHFSFAAFDSGAIPVEERGTSFRSSKLLMGGNCVLLAKPNPLVPTVCLRFQDEAGRAIASSEFLVLSSRAQPCLLCEARLA